MAWDVPGPSSLRFQKGELVSKVFPGLLTVSLLAAEGLPVVLVSSALLRCCCVVFCARFRSPRIFVLSAPSFSCNLSSSSRS